MAVERQRLTPAERANLVAYLDGELSGPEADAIATRLTSSPVVRYEIESLRRTWDLLDILPKPQAPPDFTVKTLAVLEGQARAEGQLGERLQKVVRQAVRLALLGLVAAAMFGLGFAVVRWVWPDPTARLERELSIAEHLDEYRAIRGSFEFLRQLDELAAFRRMEVVPEASP